MSLFESGHSTGEVSLGGLFAGEEAWGHSTLDLQDIAERIVCGGWPGVMGKSTTAARRRVAGYCREILGTRVPSAGTPDREVARDPERMRAILVSLSVSESSSAPDTRILSDAASMGAPMSMNTLRDYLAALRRTYVMDDLPAWVPRLRTKAVVRTSGTRHLCDPSVAAHFLGVSADGLMRDFGTFGLLFESLVVRDLRVYAGTMGADVGHYRDSDGLEADAVVHIGRTGEWGAIEVRLGQGMVDEAARNLLRIRDKVASEPSFLAVVTGTKYAYTREDGVHVIPVGCLRNRRLHTSEHPAAEATLYDVWTPLTTYGFQMSGMRIHLQRGEGGGGLRRPPGRLGLPGLR